jgi:hypothetical protein
LEAKTIVTADDTIEHRQLALFGVWHAMTLLRKPDQSRRWLPGLIEVGVATDSPIGVSTAIQA